MLLQTAITSLLSIKCPGGYRWKGPSVKLSKMAWLNFFEISFPDHLNSGTPFKINGMPQWFFISISATFYILIDDGCTVICGSLSLFHIKVIIFVLKQMLCVLNSIWWLGNCQSSVNIKNSRRNRSSKNNTTSFSFLRNDIGDPSRS